MTAKEAKELMLTAPQSETKKAALNPGLTQKQAHGFINKMLQEESDDTVLSHLVETRIWQIVRNQKRPRF